METHTSTNLQQCYQHHQHQRNTYLPPLANYLKPEAAESSGHPAQGDELLDHFVHPPMPLPASLSEKLNLKTAGMTEMDLLHSENFNLTCELKQERSRFAMEGTQLKTEVTQLLRKLELIQRDRDAWREQTINLNWQLKEQQIQQATLQATVHALNNQVGQMKTSFNEQQRNLNKMVYYNQRLVSKIHEVRTEQPPPQPAATLMSLVKGPTDEEENKAAETEAPAKQLSRKRKQIKTTSEKQPSKKKCTT